MPLYTTFQFSMQDVGVRRVEAVSLRANPYTQVIAAIQHKSAEAQRKTGLSLNFFVSSSLCVQLPLDSL